MFAANQNILIKPNEAFSLKVYHDIFFQKYSSFNWYIKVFKCVYWCHLRIQSRL